MKTVREWLGDWVSMHSERNLDVLGVLSLLDCEAHSAQAAVDLLNDRIDNMRMWMEGVRPQLPVHDRIMAALKQEQDSVQSQAP